jgi:nickel/cobalt transporter (NicO) family protein
LAFFSLRKALVGALLLGAAAQPALAHPHIFIDAELTIGFDAEGRIATLSNSWTFDTAFSVWMVQGLDVDGDGTVSPEEMQGLADENMIGLADYGFYTYAGDGLALQAAGDQRMRYEDNRVTLEFTLDAVAPQAPGARFEIGVYDPEYYVAIAVAEAADVHLDNAPEDCNVHLEPPVPMTPEVEERLYSLGPEVLELPPDLAAAMRGTQGMVVVECGPAPAPANALEAANQVGEQRAAPFGGPPPEVGLNLPRSGFFGWLQQQQRDFYAAMTGALDALRTDWTAFWVLGGLSFLYGIFHAAGPGHGKVVISSYVLANERQLKQGIVLSALSALLQSLVAIGFVLVLAGLLNWTSTALGEAAHWVGVVSYGMVALLGLWLVVRKLFGLGHRHDGHHDHAHAHELLYDDVDGHGHHHGHDHDHGHMHHAVAPRDLRGNWREQLGVVLSVGLRPCSGALVVMVFALSQGLLPAGMLAVLLMGVGTAITVAALATLAVTVKGLASRIGGAESPMAARFVWWAELAGAVAVLAFGVMLLIAAL